MSACPVLRLRELDWQCSGRRLVSNVSLQIEAGEICAVIGPNGAGKSSLVHAATGHASGLRGGSAELFGRELSTLSAAELALHRSVLLQQVELAWSYSVAEVIAFACWQQTREEKEQVLARVREEWALELLWEKHVNELSGGEQRRVHLARTVAQIYPRLLRSESALLLLDEPFAHLDPGGDVWLEARLRKLADAGGAQLCVMHDPNLALRLADKTLVLQESRQLAFGSSREVINEALLAGLYGVPFTTFTGPDGLPWFVPERSLG